jgi:uncharacterized protein
MQVIGDTSAIVSVLRENEQYHGWAVATLREIAKPIVTCEAVIAEACFLLGGSKGGTAALLGQIREGMIRIDFSLADEIERVTQLISKYKDVPMSLADGCLVRMAELMADSAIFTLDSDFRVYRKNVRHMIPVIMPPL